MKRFHVHVSVDALTGSIGFHFTLFATQPPPLPENTRRRRNRPRRPNVLSHRGLGASMP